MKTGGCFDVFFVFKCNLSSEKKTEKPLCVECIAYTNVTTLCYYREYTMTSHQKNGFILSLKNCFGGFLWDFRYWDTKI